MRRSEGKIYSLIIAEGELTTRRGLVNMVKWNEFDFRADGEFSDGQALLEYLRSDVPNVILTDIKMNHVSGWGSSGYKDFAYAQSAVEYHVLHYLVKPVSIPKLKENARIARLHIGTIGLASILPTNQ